MHMYNVFYFIFIFLISLLFTRAIHYYSLKFNLLDIPNSRSLHKSAIPHGGGLSIVIIFLVFVGFSDLVSGELTYVFLTSGLIVALVGFWDDHGHIDFKWRLLAHFIAAMWAVFSLGDFEIYYAFIAVFALVWLLNLFNFMDGIDGIAASEAIFVLCGGAYFLWLDGLKELHYISLIFAAIISGFLVLNWSPAKIFMGDVASGFLGIILGIIAYSSIIDGSEIWVWLILLAVFLVDTGLTLIVRTIKGEKWYEAHCSHAYQHAAKKWGHKKTTFSVILINIFWLLPFAAFAHKAAEYAPLITTVSFLPLIIVTLKLKAGVSN